MDKKIINIYKCEKREQVVMNANLINKKNSNYKIAFHLTLLTLLYVFVFPIWGEAEIEFKPYLGGITVEARIPPSSGYNRIFIKFFDNHQPNLATSEPITDINQMPNWIQALSPPSGSYYLTSDVTTTNLSNWGIAIDSSSVNKKKILCSYFGRQTHHILVVYYNSQLPSASRTYRCEYFSGELHFEFFKGESAVLNTYFPIAPADAGQSAALKYFRQSLSFMSLILFYNNQTLKGQFNTLIREKLDNLDVITSPQQADLVNWLTDPNAEEHELAKIAFLDAVGEFKKTFVANFSVIYQKLVQRQGDGTSELYIGPVLNFSRSAFEAVYGTLDLSSSAGINRNPYITAYLLFLYSEMNNKPAIPVFATLLQQLNGNNITYDFNQYRMLGFNNGVETNEGDELAEAALRYLTWGVEYTTVARNNTVILNGTGSMVYGYNQVPIQKWIGALQNDEPATAVYNYYPGLSSENPPAQVTTLATSGTSVLHPVHITEGRLQTDMFQLASRKKSDSTLTISKIDLWSGRNLAWDPLVIDMNLSHGNLNGSTARLFNDKDRSENVVITRTNDEVIRVGYSFRSNTSIQAVLVIGRYISNLVNNADIQIRVTRSNNQVTTLQRNMAVEQGSTLWYKEFRTEESGMPQIKQYRYWPRLTQQPSDPEVAYHYYIFNQAIEDVEAVELVMNNLTSVTLEEIAVFGCNPIYYIDPGSTLNAGEIARTSSFLSNGPGINHLLYNYLYFNTDISQGFDFLGIGEVVTDYVSLRKQAVITSERITRVAKGARVEVWGRNGDFYRIRLPNGLDGYALIRDLADSNNIYIALKNDVFMLGQNFTRMSNLESVVLWEAVAEGEPSAESAFSQEPVCFTTANAFLLEALLKDPNPNIATHQIPFNTPFKYFGNAIVGNPLPFAPLGIDTPRTFAWKLYEQEQTRALFPYLLYQESGMNLPSLRALDRSGYTSFYDGYKNEIDFFTLNNRTLSISSSTQRYLTYLSVDDPYPPVFNNRQYKPYLPGIVANNSLGYVAYHDSLYSPDKIAGVDSMGLLVGALSMTTYKDLVLNLNNQAPAVKVNSYSSLVADVNNPLLNESGHPRFYTAENMRDSVVSNQGLFKLTLNDLEKCSVLVPDISLLRKGDLLVRYLNDEIESEPHIGIVVGLGWELAGGVRPAFGTDASVWWNQVYVVSIRRGLVTASLSSWGNSSQCFGGFTTDPQAYQIRRLLLLKTDATGTPVALQTSTQPRQPWELITEIPVKLRQDYPERNKVPATGTHSQMGDDQTITFAMTVWNNQNNVNYLYHRELPSTSLSSRAKVSIFERGKTMQINCYTGWRDLNGIRYHRGVDIITNAASIGDPQTDGRGPKLYAPEDGKFWLYNELREQPIDNALRVNADLLQKIKLSTNDINNRLLIDTYSENTYGFVGVLLTRPERPEEGRIYLFCHMGPPSVVCTWDALPYREDYTTIYGQYPLGVENAINVKAGQWIGYMGTRGQGTGPHVHMEVYEYFQDSPNTVSIADVDVFAYWERVEPLSVFDPLLYQITYLNNNNLSDIRIHNTYGWWSRNTGTRDDFGNEAQNYDNIQNGLQGTVIKPAIINSWYLSDRAYSIWVSALYRNNFSRTHANNSYDKVFVPNIWEVARAPEFPR